MNKKTLNLILTQVFIRRTCTTKSLKRFYVGRERRYKIVTSFQVNVPFLHPLITSDFLMLSGVIERER